MGAGVCGWGDMDMSSNLNAHIMSPDLYLACNKVGPKLRLR